MRNTETKAAWEYHSSTKHSLESLRASRHYLDWQNQPRPYKLYKELEGLPLPQQLKESKISALSALSCLNPYADSEQIPDLKTLTSVLHYSAGITKVRSALGGSMAYRAAACTGALYHIELYVVCGSLPDLGAGVYHFSVHDRRLRQLRSGDYRGLLGAATGGQTGMVAAPVTVVCTSTFWRNSWKYQARTYRHCFWDNGTILANMLGVASAYDLAAQIVAGFEDAEVNRLLDLDGEKEVALTLVPLGYAPSMRSEPSPAMEKLGLETVALSRTEVDYPAIRNLHRASSLTSPSEVVDWRGRHDTTSMPPPKGTVVPLVPLELAVAPQDGIERVIRRRGSSRGFQQVPISFEALSTLLSAASRGIPADFLGPTGAALNDMYLIVNAVEGLESGTYVYHRDRQALELLQVGNFRREAGHLDLGQELAADAAVNVYFLADLGPILERFDNRGYRVAQLDASVTAGKLYLAAYALRIGATGLTFFDDDVTKFFSPHAEGKSVMFLLALGVPLNRRSV